MKKIFSEQNIAAILFLLVFIVFSFAHEDSKKRQTGYNASLPAISVNNSNPALVNNQEKPTGDVQLANSINQE